MSAPCHQRETCRLCESADLVLALELAATPPADFYLSRQQLGDKQDIYPLELMLCRNCGHAQLHHVLAPDILYGEYLYRTASSPGLAEYLERYANDVLRHADVETDSLVIDIGSNDGAFLRAFRSRGMRVLGIDPTPRIARIATESGIETLPLFFSAELARKIRADYGRAAIITSTHFVANTDDLRDMLAGIEELLTPNGIFVFETIYLPDLMANTGFDFIYHEHLSYFSVAPLERFFRAHGMALVNAERLPTKGGSVRYTVQLAPGASRVSPSVGNLIAHEERSGVRQLESFAAFAARIGAARSALHSLLSATRGDQSTIEGYGASATTTTLIYQLQLGRTLSCIYDDNPVKVGLFSPGYHIPVVSSATLLSHNPDHVLIIAWRYSRQIIKKLAAYRERGGRFIVPLPQPQVI